MPDERLDSMRQGIAPAPESPEAQHADAERREDNRAHPMQMESAMGGSSDAESAGDQADMESDLHIGLPDDRTAAAGRDKGSG